MKRLVPKDGVEPYGDQNGGSVRAGEPCEPPRTQARYIALLPFVAAGSLIIRVMRGLWQRGIPVALAYCGTSRSYTADPMEDFAAAGRLIDLSSLQPGYYLDRIQRELKARGTELILQVGASWMYPVLPYLKESNSSLKFADIIYNEVGHTINHFLYENVFDAVIVESRHMANFVRDRSMKSEPNIMIAESGIDLETFRPAPPRSEGWRPKVGYIGRMAPEKNPVGFVQIAKALGKRFDAIDFVLYGEGPQSRDIQNLVSKSGLAERLAFGGHAKSVADALRQLDVLVVPSLLDGRPNIVMEASACGVPVVGAPVGGIPELIDIGQNGILARPNDFEIIGDHIGEWLRSSSAIAAIQVSCRNVAEARFNQAQMLDNYLSAFDEILRL